MTDAERMIELETKISHQEIAIEELQAVSIDQHALITLLQKNLKQLTDRFDGATTNQPEIGPGNEKPPHY
jgi:uncharacterized coiled-coil protein SlyX